MAYARLRVIRCAVEFRRGMLFTLCGVEMPEQELLTSSLEEMIVTCELCIAEMERRWLDPPH